MGAYRFLERNHYLSTQAGLVKEWRDQDVVAFSQLVDFTGVERVRDARQSEGRPKPSYTACIIASIVRALKDHPKLNRLVYRGLSGYRWVQFEQIDIAVGTEVTEGDLDLAYASIIRNVDQLGVDGIANALVQVASAPSESPQLKRLKRFPAAVVSVLARGTGMHPKLWVQFRGGSCAITSPAKYGVENILVKSCWPLQFAFGKVKARPMVVDDRCIPRQSAMLSLSWHRELTTGAVAARFFEQVVRQLEESIDL
ncbi:MAG TPA: 2-oxo acid dehydrogenase subunit E2 [Bryobacteraceae bacterium]|jgi:pyruvate/2-oxoglutarate dehydrogenase complex dihydrolipoamide acyltransferase (E2) component|nr:2-oxo acid dehydrogenase subunit E2 [Bryobacteraceae bacterium]